MKCRSVFRFLIVCAIFSATHVVADEQQLIEQMQSGNVVLMMRHANAPGMGDPANFDVLDCATQRNLDDAGREQAKAIGRWLRDHNIQTVKLYSSQWCRCLETARLMQMGAVTPLPILNSFYQQPQHREPRLMAIRKFIQENTKPGELLIMVTHQVTISGVSDKWTDSGEGKLIQADKAGNIRLLGELDFKDQGLFISKDILNNGKASLHSDPLIHNDSSEITSELQQRVDIIE